MRWGSITFTDSPTHATLARSSNRIESWPMLRPVENQPLMAKKAVEWIDQQKPGKPFFLYFPLGIPHEPIVPSAEFTGKSGATDVVKNDPKYGDWLYEGDAFLGQIMSALERNHLAENTLLIATSDNGAEHRAYPPLRESKRSIYEGGHRVPFVARWPGKVQAGSVNDHTVCLNDLLSTAAEITGATIPDNAAEDSVSLLPELLALPEAAFERRRFISPPAEISHFVRDRGKSSSNRTEKESCSTSRLIRAKRLMFWPQTWRSLRGSLP